MAKPLQISFAHWNQRRYDNAIEWANKTLELDPRHQHAREHLAGVYWKKAVPPAARIEQTVTVGVPIAAVCCDRTRLQLRPFLHWCVCPKESMAPGRRLNIGEAVRALP